MPTRRAIITSTDKAIADYLPARYTVVAVTEDSTIIEGEDFHGWTLDGYVLPRLASGWFFGTEIFS